MLAACIPVRSVPSGKPKVCLCASAAPKKQIPASAAELFHSEHILGRGAVQLHALETRGPQVHRQPPKEKRSMQLHFTGIA